MTIKSVNDFKKYTGNRSISSMSAVQTVGSFSTILTCCLCQWHDNWIPDAHKLSQSMIALLPLSSCIAKPHFADG